MKGAATVIEVVFISMIIVAAASFTLYWAWPKLQTSIDIGEITSVKEAMVLCDSKIVETARTGIASRCVIPQSRGEINLETNGILYTINSQGNICDLTGWTVLDKNHNIWQRCPTEVSYSLKWYWPVEQNITGSMSGALDSSSITFVNPANFFTIDTIVNFDVPQKLTGKAIEISRVNITEETATLKINMI